MTIDSVKFKIDIDAETMRKIAKQSEGVNVQTIAQDIITQIPTAINTERKFVHWADTWLNYSEEQENELRKLFEDKGYKVTTAYYQVPDSIFVLHVAWG